MVGPSWRKPHLPLPTDSSVIPLKTEEPGSAPLLLGHTEARLQDHLRLTEGTLNPGILLSFFLT